MREVWHSNDLIVITLHILGFICYPPIDSYLSLLASNNKDMPKRLKTYTGLEVRIT